MNLLWKALVYVFYAPWLLTARACGRGMWEVALECVAEAADYDKQTDVACAWLNRMAAAFRGDDNGFTLIELLIVLAILGILAGVVMMGVGATGAGIGG